MMLREHPAHEIRTYEPGSPTYERPHPFFTPQSYPISGSSNGRLCSSGSS
jgi:hypothetical protein